MKDILPILSTLRRHKTTAVLLVLEIALTCAIVCNAVFLIGQRLDRIGLPSGVAESELVQLSMGGIGLHPDARARMQEDLSALRRIPGVRAATSTSQVPLAQEGGWTSIGLAVDQAHASAEVSTFYGEDLIDTFGLDLIEGRNFTPGEYRWIDDIVADGGAAKSRTVIVTQALAGKLFPGVDPLGKTLYVGPDPVRIVGVVRHLIVPAVRNPGEQDYSVLVPIRMTASAPMGMTYVLRTSPGQREHVLKAAAETLKALDPKRIVTRQLTFETIRSDYFASDRATSGLLVAVCLSLLVVTALGIVGLGSFWVAQRRRQIGVRRALGARRRDILRYFQTENFLLATIGIALGMMLAYGINLFLMVHYELPRLPLAYLPVGAIVLWLLGQAAVLAPALRAASVPPVVATRG